MNSAIREAVKVLRDGGLILCPTDSLWGISCDANNESAVQKVMELKNRPAEKSFILLLNGEHMVERYFKEVPEVAWDLFETAIKPTTLVLDKPLNVAASMIHSTGTLGVRIVKEGICADIIHTFNRGILSTSPNLSGQASPARFEDIDEQILKGIDYVIPLQHAPSNMTGQASTIIRLQSSGLFEILRK